MPDLTDETRDRIRRILLDDWDPSNAARFEHSHGEYDSYIGPLFDLIRNGAGETAVVQFLNEREREDTLISLMGDPVRRARLGAAARALVIANRGAKDKTMAAIAEEAHQDPEIAHNAPHQTAMRRLDETQAARHPKLRWTRE